MGATRLAGERRPASPPGPVELFEAGLARLGKRAPVARLLLGEAALAEGVAGLRAPDTPRPRYHTSMASVRRDDSLLTLIGHTAMVYGVSFGRDPERGLLLASGSDDGSIRLWDPFTGAPTREPLLGHGDDVGPDPGVAPWGQTMKPSETYWTTGLEVEAVEFGTAQDGQLLLASVGCDRTVRVWDPVTGEPLGKPLTGHTGRIWSLAACRIPDGRLLLASGGDDCTMRIWDAQQVAPIGGPLTGHTDQVVMVALCVTADGNCLLASASSDCTVRLWDPLTGTPLGGPLTGHDAPAFASRGSGVQIPLAPLGIAGQRYGDHVVPPLKIICHSDVTGTGRQRVTLDMPKRLLRARPGIRCRAREGHSFWVSQAHCADRSALRGVSPSPRARLCLAGVVLAEACDGRQFGERRCLP